MIKKTLLILIMTLVVFSCSDDNDNNNLTTDQIIGTWNNIASSEGEWSECREKSTATFTKDNKFWTQSYGNNSAGTCKEEKEASISIEKGVKWKKISNDTYELVDKNNQKIPVTIKDNILIIGIESSTDYDKYKKQ